MKAIAEAETGDNIDDQERMLGKQVSYGDIVQVCDICSVLWQCNRLCYYRCVISVELCGCVTDYVSTGV